MKPYVYVISDIHGQADLFDALLTDYDPVEHQLVLIGDLNDRGPDSKACFLKGKIIQARPLFLVILLPRCYMVICRQRTFGKVMEKLG